MKIFLFVTVILFSAFKANAVHEATTFGKIVGIESRSWGMHIQTDFAAGGPNGCATQVGNTYMYDFVYANNNFGGDPSDEIAMILAAYASQTKIAFHIYGCNGDRPSIGYIRLSR